MSYLSINYGTHGENFYNITAEVKKGLSQICTKGEQSGILHLFTTHTSCALAISEAFDPLANKDVVEFFKYLAPRNLPFIQHRDEGEDDSPSHMKSVILNQNISLIVEKGELVLGQWQGIYLAEFRDQPHQRKILLKFQADR